ncbi:FkbM family methyltransferase [Microvirga ossetica]|uniref:FkbM family methyltransferase n=1 Tax=Microvirga ossetica TaxID=1882682 RepID=UPI000C14C62C|nr:FkbM family methyltransferase [Microvirga ossetica]
MINLSRDQLDSLTSTATTQYGKLNYFRNDDPIGKALEAYGEWAEVEISFLLQFLHPDDVALDIGANIGTHSIAFAQRVGQNGRVHAFEPQGPIFEVLSINAAINNLTNIDARRCGAGAVRSTLVVPATDYMAHANFGAVQLLDDTSAPGETVDILPIDELCLDRVNFIKIDAEGMNHYVIDGAHQTITRCSPIVFSECNSIEEGYLIIERIRRHGYRCIYVSTPAFNSDNIKHQTLNFFGHAEESGLLFLPPSFNSTQIERADGKVTIAPINTLEDLATAFIATPRYGDVTPYDRDPKGLHNENTRLNGEITRLNGEITRLNGEITRQRFQIVDANARTEATLSKLQEAEQHWPSLHAQLKKELRSREVFYKRKLKARDVLLHSVYNSTSWKFARPIRGAKKAIEAIRRTTAGLVRARTGSGSSSLGAMTIGHELHPPRKAGATEHAQQKTVSASAQPLTQGSTIDPVGREGKHDKKNKQGSRTVKQDAIFDTSRRVTVPAPPTLETWRNLADALKLRPAHNPAIDIIVPVYGQARETLNCLAHVLSATQKTGYELIVIDDCGPDKDLPAQLEELAALGLFTLLKNRQNLGFVATVNRGMQLHPDRDVLLLNSDTAVYGDWLDRILKSAHSEDKIGTITPLSNNATICSYPKFVSDNDDELELDNATLDQIAAEVNAGKSVEIPTGVGFCMFISRACIAEVGLFDVENFGRGYGEENDFCRRAAKRGWRNILVGDVFVRHYGGASFGDTKHARVMEAQKKLEKLHPEYFSLVHQFIKDDPVLEIRERLDIERLRRTASTGEAMLFITLGRGGGTERHVQEMKSALEAEGTPVFIARSNTRQHGVLSLDSHGLCNVPNLPTFDVPEDVEALVRAIRALNIKHIHVQHLADAGDDVEQMIRTAAESVGLNYDVTVHDYMFICPRINLIGQSGLYCGEPEDEGCNACLKAFPSIAGHHTIQDWRGRFGEFLSGARAVFVPSTDVAKRLRRYYPQTSFVVRPHFTAMNEPVSHRSSHHSSRRIAIIGAIGPHKGVRLLLECAKYAASQGVPLSFVVIGYTAIDDELRTLPNVTITGAYGEADVQRLIAEHAPDIAWFPAVWPETFSYTLSVAFEAGLFPVTYDFGAPAERMRAVGWGATMPLEHMMSVPEMVHFLQTVSITPPPEGIWQASNVSYGSILSDYYRLPPI